MIFYRIRQGGCGSNSTVADRGNLSIQEDDDGGKRGGERGEDEREREEWLMVRSFERRK